MTKLKGKKVLVTGGAGFIGCNLVRRLLKEGAYVRVFDNFSTGKRENLKDIRGAIDLIEGDLRDFALVIEATKDIQIVFHEAALPSVIRSVKAPLTTNDVNTTGTLNLLEAVRINSVKKVIYASSSSVYGDSQELPKREDMILNPLSPYAVSKLAGEYYMQVYHKLYGIETIVLRYFNVYGPYQDPSSEYSGVIAKFINAFIENKPITVYGDGEQTRDFTYVDDAVDANVLAGYTDLTGNIFNIATGHRFSLNMMITTLKSHFRKYTGEVTYTNPRAGDVRNSLADISRAKIELNYKTNVEFDKGLKETISYFTQRHTSLF